MTRLAFSIPGEPKGKDRARAYASIVETDDGPKAVVRMVTPPETVKAEKAIRLLFARKFPKHQRWTGAVLIKFVAVFETPKSFNSALQAAAAEGRLHAIKKPDKDNIEKLIADALNGLAWHDDAQVMGGGLKKYGSPARVDVWIESLDSPDIPATPGQMRRDRGKDRNDAASPELALGGNPTKSKNKPAATRYPPALQARIDAALARERGD